uniref:Uncharacterized protein n=1 Tax=Anopheles merus TaxID=30066 RepID=A0A182V3H8_ANOME
MVSDGPASSPVHFQAGSNTVSSCIMKIVCSRSNFFTSSVLSSSDVPRSSRVESHIFSRMRPWTELRELRASSLNQPSRPVEDMGTDISATGPLQSTDIGPVFGAHNGAPCNIGSPHVPRRSSLRLSDSRKTVATRRKHGAEASRQKRYFVRSTMSFQAAAAAAPIPVGAERWPVIGDILVSSASKEENFLPYNIQATVFD